MAKRFVCALFSQQLPASCSLLVCLLIAMQQCPEAVVRIGSKVWGLGKQDEEKVPGPQRWHLAGWVCKGIWSMASAGAPRWRAAVAKLQMVKCPDAGLAFPRCFGDESEPRAKDLLSPALFFHGLVPNQAPGIDQVAHLRSGRQEAVSPPRCCVSFATSLNFSVPFTPTVCLSVLPELQTLLARADPVA